MSSFEQSVHEWKNVQAIADYLEARVRNALLERIVMFGGDPEFMEICLEGARAYRISNAQAAELLWPTAQVIYRAAEGVDIAVDCMVQLEASN